VNNNRYEDSNKHLENLKLQLALNIICTCTVIPLYGIGGWYITKYLLSGDIYNYIAFLTFIPILLWYGVRQIIRINREMKSGKINSDNIIQGEVPIVSINKRRKVFRVIAMILCALAIFCLILVVIFIFINVLISKLFVALVLATSISSLTFFLIAKLINGSKHK
jgi:hypothetical protein